MTPEQQRILRLVRLASWLLIALSFVVMVLSLLLTMYVVKTGA